MSPQIYRVPCKKLIRRPRGDVFLATVFYNPNKKVKRRVCSPLSRVSETSSGSPAETPPPHRQLRAPRVYFVEIYKGLKEISEVNEMSFQSNRTGTSIYSSAVGV